MSKTSLYIHIPWCIRKCPYCDFNSHKSPDTLPEQQYIDALIADLDEDLLYLPAREISSIFIGGGTPSLLSAQAYNSLFTALQKRLPFAKNMEITLEANPGTVEQRRFHDYRSLGINRLSLGIQSFNPVHLKALGRIHDDKQAQQAICTARQAGFDNLNLDLMHGLPDQSIEQGLQDLHEGLKYEPEHLSWYQLTLEPNTVFYKKPPSLPDEETSYLLEEQGFQLLQNQGYQRYEISAFCRQNRQSRHNLNYWLFGDYYGIGAGAHGKLTLDSGEIIRTQKVRQPTDFLRENKPFLAEKRWLTAAEAIFEFMLNTSRLETPIANTLFTKRTGFSWDALFLKLKTAVQKGLIQLEPDSWYVTPLGRRFTNNLQELFLP